MQEEGYSTEKEEEKLLITSFLNRNAYLLCRPVRNQVLKAIWADLLSNRGFATYIYEILELLRKDPFPMKKEVFDKGLDHSYEYVETNKNRHNQKW